MSAITCAYCAATVSASPAVSGVIAPLRSASVSADAAAHSRSSPRLAATPFKVWAARKASCP